MLENRLRIHLCGSINALAAYKTSVKQFAYDRLRIIVQESKENKKKEAAMQKLNETMNKFSSPRKGHKRAKK